MGIGQAKARGLLRGRNGFDYRLVIVGMQIRKNLMRGLIVNPCNFYIDFINCEINRYKMIC